MKKVRRFLVLVVVFALMFSFVSCKGNTSGGGGNDESKIVAGEYLMFKSIENGKEDSLFSDMGSDFDVETIKGFAKMCTITIDKDGKGTMTVMSQGAADLKMDPNSGKMTMTVDGKEETADYKFVGDELQLTNDNSTMCFLKEDSKEWEKLIEKKD